MDNLISIVVPCYNQAQYLDECLSSVINQTYNYWECIIVNDGSSDGTEKIALEWVNKDNRFKYYSKINGGLSDTRNFGIKKAAGAYILPLDADDYIGTELLELSLNVFNKDENVTIVYSDVMNFGTINGLSKVGDFNFGNFLFSNMISCTAMYRKVDYEKTDGYDINLKYGSEDWDFWLSLLEKNNLNVYKLNYVGLYYRRKEHSMLVDYQKSKDKINYTHNYIFNKHIKSFNEYYGDPIMVYSKMHYLEKKIQPFLKLKAILRKFTFRK